MRRAAGQAGPPALTPDALAARARGAAAGRPLLVLSDYDGTLVPIAPTPDQARPGPELLALLARLAAAPNRGVAVVSGRSLAELQHLLPVPGLRLAGDHGGTVAGPGGAVSWAADPEALAPVWADLRRTTAPLVAAAPGCFLEQKPLALALHYRLADPAAAARVQAAVARHWAEAAARHGLALLAGKRVLELRPRGIDKGAACALLQRQWPEALPLYLGDDTTDEDAFRAVGGAGGLGVLVGRPRPTAAGFRLAGPAATLRLLTLLADPDTDARKGEGQ